MRSCLRVALVSGLWDVGLAAVGQGADDVGLLARRARGLAVLGVVHRAARDHLDFKVGTRQRQLPVLDLDQQVGQHGQGLASFDDVDHLAQRLQEYFALQTETHAGSFRSEEHTSELQSLMRISYAVFCLTKKNSIQYHSK